MSSSDSGGGVRVVDRTTELEAGAVSVLGGPVAAPGDGDEANPLEDMVPDAAIAEAGGEERTRAVQERDQRSSDRLLAAALVAEVEVEKLSEEALRRYFAELCRACMFQACDEPTLLSSTRLSDATRRSFAANATRVAALRGGPDAKRALRDLWGLSVPEQEGRGEEGGSESDTEGEEEEGENNSKRRELLTPTGSHINPGKEEEEGESNSSDAAKRRDALTISRFTVFSCARRLVCEKDLHWLEAEALYTDLLAALRPPHSCPEDRQRLTQMLVLLLPPQSSAVGADGNELYSPIGGGGHGAQVLAAGLLSPAPGLRSLTCQLLDLLSSFPSTHGCVLSLNPMLRTAYTRQRAKSREQRESEVKLWHQRRRSQTAAAVEEARENLKAVLLDI